MALEATLSIRKVVPSARAAITSVTAGTVLPPGLLTTLTGTFQRASSSWAMTRALESVDAPAANGTMISIGLVGYLLWAWAPDVAVQTSAASASTSVRSIGPVSSIVFLKVAATGRIAPVSCLVGAVPDQSHDRARAVSEPDR